MTCYIVAAATTATITAAPSATGSAAAARTSVSASPTPSYGSEIAAFASQYPIRKSNRRSMPVTCFGG